jgi:hypothetical protein
MAVLLGAAVSGTARPAQAYLPTPTPPPCIPIDQAIAQGLVRVSLTGSGDLFYKTPIHYRVENLTDQPLVICFPVGMLLDPGDGSMQTMMVAVTAVIELGAGEVREGDLAAFCINETKHAPSEGAAYQVGGTAEGSLLNLAYAIDAQSADGHIGAQLAVWAITDGFNLNELSVTPEPGNPTLVETIAPLLCLAQEEITLSQQLLEQAEAGVSLFQGENPLTAACEEQGIPSLDSILDRLKVIGIGAAVALALGGLVCIGLVVLLIVLVVRMLRKRK